MTNQSAVIQSGIRTRPVEKQIEQDLVQRACHGNKDAFGLLYERTVDRVYRYVYFRVTDDETAEDLTSKVYLKAWEHLPSFKESSSPFIAWLYTIARNTVIDHYRTHRQETHLDEIVELPDRDPLPHEQCEHDLDAQSLRRALQRLTPEQKNVVTMKLIDGLSTDEIAVRLRKSQGAVRALQMRGLQALAKIVQKEAAVDTEES